MVLPQEGCLLRIFVGEGDRHGKKPPHEWVVLRAREKGLAGATMLCGVMGFGAHSRLHAFKIERLSEDLPIVMEIVDTREELENLLSDIDGGILEELATLERAEVRFYRAVGKPDTGAYRSRRDQPPESVTRATAPSYAEKPRRPGGIMPALRALSFIALLSMGVVLASLARAATPLTTIRVASGLTAPVFATAPPGDTTRLFIVEKRAGDLRGRIKILEHGSVLPTPFLTTEVLAPGFEQGLLGLAFAPDYASSGRFYINYTNATGRTIVARHTVSEDPNVANPDGTVILDVYQPYGNHNGGWLGFGPDGYLYVALGDGGSGGDPGDRAQNPDSLLGKILRLDVSGSGYSIPPGNPFAGAAPGADEVWMTGLRNPWRPSFDRETGDFVIADVGQELIEEINFVPAGSGAGLNFGWRCYEGDDFYAESATIPCGSCLAAGCPKIFPAYDYGHGPRCSVTGGYVYRGCAIPDLEGTYVFADWCTGEIFSGRFEADSLADFRNRTVELAPGGGLGIGSVLSFGEDGTGELYICDADGEIYKIVPAATVLEADMPVLRSPVASGDTLGATSPGNALTPGITAFADAGSRIRGVGYIGDATLRSCATLAGGCLTASMWLDPFTIDVESCVDSVASMLTRRFIFTNVDASPRALAYVDVIAPLLDGDDDRGSTVEPASTGASATLALYEEFNPDRWLVQSGTVRSGVATSADLDLVTLVEGRVAADQPLGGGTSGGPAPLAVALGFDFGVVPSVSPETVTVVTQVLLTPPAGLAVRPRFPPPAPRLALRPVPFQSVLHVVVDVERPSRVTIEIFDVGGRLVHRLHDSLLGRGQAEFQWGGETDRGPLAAPGVYFVRASAAGESRIRRAVFIR